MSFSLTNLIKKNKMMTNGQKNFMLYMVSYADPDGKNIFPSNATIAEDFSIGRATVIRLRNSVVRDGWLLCVKEATSKKPAAYVINVELLEICAKASVDNSDRGLKTRPLGVSNYDPRGLKLRPNHPITNQLTCINTVGFNNSVDNSDMEVANEPIIESDLLADDDKTQEYIAIRDSWFPLPAHAKQFLASKGIGTYQKHCERRGDDLYNPDRIAA